MGFYTSIAPYYDLVFPFDEKTFSFLESVIDVRGDRCPEVRKGCDPVSRHSYLDIGCGTGSMLSAFSDRFKHVVGIDLDPGLLEIAAKKLLPGESGKVELLEESMEHLAHLFPEEEFSFITCLGNTLPHLTTSEAFVRFFKEVSDILESDGVFVFQTLNYDRILGEKTRSLPLLDRDTVTFERYYSLPGDDGLIQFETRLLDKKKDITIENTIPLRPLTQKMLKDALLGAGFSRMSLYSDFEGNEWKPDAFLTVGVAMLH